MKPTLHSSSFSTSWFLACVAVGLAMTGCAVGVEADGTVGGSESALSVSPLQLLESPSVLDAPVDVGGLLAPGLGDSAVFAVGDPVSACYEKN